MSAPLIFLLQLLCFAVVVVSKFQVKHLPGLDGPLPFELETGYVNVDETNGIELFYYFVKSENNPVEDPLLIWFSGGPGCSGLNAILFGNGPFVLKIEEYTGNLPRLELNPYGWSKVSNVLYVDAPVGAGFSYSATVQGTYTNDTLSAKQSYTFIRKWLMDHIEFLPNTVLIAGDSYSGMVVPIIVENIAEGIEAGDKPLINLKGYLLGNPVTFPDREDYLTVPFAHGKGIISQELYESFRKNCQWDYTNEFPRSVDCDKDRDAVKECLKGIWPFNVLLPYCEESDPAPNKMNTNKIPKRSMVSKFDTMDISWKLSGNPKNLVTSSSSPIPSMKCLTAYGHFLGYYWANNERVQDALNVQKRKVQTFTNCMSVVNYTCDLNSRVPYHFNLSKRGIRSLIYSGDHDLVVSFLSTEEWIRSLGYSITDEWRPWIVDKQVQGYTRTYANNMTYATIKGGSHVALNTNPKGCFAMYRRWMSYQPL